MFQEPSSMVLRMIQRAMSVYKHIYGEYPEQVGLDLFTRFREWRKTLYLDTYIFPVFDGFNAEGAMLATNVSVKVEPATFCAVIYDKYGLNPRPADEFKGRDEIWCKLDEHEVVIHLLLSNLGYQAVLISKEEWQGHLDDFHAYLLYCGYEIPRDSQEFQVLYNFYVRGEWGRLSEYWDPVGERRIAVLVWNTKVKQLLAPFQKVGID